MKVLISETCNLEVVFEVLEQLSYDKQQAIKDINLIARDSGIKVKLTSRVKSGE